MLTDKELKEELHALEGAGAGDRYISALLSFGGALGREEKGLYLSYTTHDYLLAWEMAGYMREHYRYHGEVSIVDPDDKRRNRVYCFEMRGKAALDLLSDLGKIKREKEEIVSFDLGVKSKIASEKDAGEYARAVYLSVGSLTRAAEGLRLEMVFELESDADAFLAFLKKEDILLSKSEKGNKITLHTRKGQTISDFCALMGANKSVLVLQDMLVQKYVDGKTARAGNLMLANTDKSVSAAIRQYHDAVTLRDATCGFIGVPKEIKDVAEARIEHADISLDELVERLPEKITKSGLYHRLQKLHELAEKIREEGK